MKAALRAALLLSVITAQGCAADSGLTVGQEPKMITPQANKHSMNIPLKPCPDSPNCVSSEAPQGRSHIAPLEFSGSAAEAWQTLQKIILDMGGQIEEADNTFIHATYRSRIFDFVDDLTCRLDRDKNLIHVRSASRIGYYDFGVNRKRLEKLRLEFQRMSGKIEGQ